jgi:hypothetical protein
MTESRERARLRAYKPFDSLQLSWCARTKHLPLCKMQLLKTLEQPATCCRAPPLVHMRSTVRVPQPLVYKRGWPISQITRGSGEAHEACQPNAQICYHYAQTRRNEDSIYNNNNNNNNNNHSRCWAQPFKNFPPIYGNRRFIKVFTRALHWSLSWATSHINPIRIIIIIIIIIIITRGAEPSHSRTSHHFMETEGSLTCSQEPSTGPYPEPRATSIQSV